MGINGSDTMARTAMKEIAKEITKPFVISYLPTKNGLGMAFATDFCCSAFPGNERILSWQKF